MPLFIFLIFVVLYFALRSKRSVKKTNPFLKQNVKPVYRHQAVPPFVPPAPVKSPPSPVITPEPPVIAVEPFKVVMDLAKAHFGLEWREYLLSKPGTIGMEPSDVITGMAWAYQHLGQENFRDFLNSLSDKSSYQPLYEAVYGLIVSRRFKEEYIIDRLKVLAQHYHDAKQNVKDIPDPDIIDFANEPLVVKRPVAVDIIDVEPGDHKINYETVPAVTPVNHAPVFNAYNPDDYKLGKLYKDKLKLSAQETAWLNKFTFFHNMFTMQDGTCIALINLYLQILKAMVRRFANEPVSLAQYVEEIKNEAYNYARTQPNSWGYYDASNVKQSTETDLYYTVFKKTESALREAWRGGRSSASGFNSRSPAALAIYQAKIEPVLSAVIAEQIKKVPAPDEVTELQLNKQVTTRWRYGFDEIIAGAKSVDIAVTMQRLAELGRLNSENPSVENLYYEAAKALSPLDKVAGLQWYLQYIYHDQRSARIDNKELQKTTAKLLFSSAAQQEEYAALVRELIATKDLGAALSKAALFYQPKRKTIRLDDHAIEVAEKQLSGTVEVLSAYLEDEAEMELAPVPVMVAEATLDPVQTGLLDLFAGADFSLTADAVAGFAKDHGLFKNQLVESINEFCFDRIDDVLIDEEEDLYTINRDYYRQLFVK